MNSRQALKWAAGGTALLLAVGCGGAYYAYQHFNRNISAVEVHLGDAAERPQAATDALNVLVIGTDSREGLGRAYGDEGSTGHADTTLLFHVAKDRGSATVLSIPRDLMVPIPECRAGARTIPGEVRAMFNSSLGEAGRDAGCTWKTVEKLTGVRVDHFLMVNFQAVKSLSTAVGGVEVCAGKDIDDPGSHLVMRKGRHLVQGEEALAFVRTRHAVGYGGDLTRIPLQQQFLGSMIRKVKSTDTLTSPTRLWQLADAATKALTVDSAIGSVDRLKDLALDLGRVDPKGITFTTVPVLDDPRNQDHLVLRQPDAGQLFAMIATDRPLTAAPAAAPAPTTPASPASPTEAPASPAVDPGSVAVTVRNGTGIGGQAGKAVATLRGKGYDRATVGSDAEPAATGTVSYPSGHGAEAAALAAALGLPPDAAREGGGDTLVVVLGRDSGGTVASSAVPTAAPTGVPADLQRLQADDEAACAK
ncbi:Putative lytR family regulatory protein [Kitasatospora sp. MMS16-BH015]|uniref:LCP family protein n=1 Tax=Kitasatospora sp. MMS16-BH015 TaxID=2018025 RepID=UPI000CA1500A|nr:LCP family protein [Kitasatospora sp. MMS16-BH015]AUG77565.1 Putative lytR family regulatory protein [Kitasatospora sp. MMS16-BH015]